MIAARSVYFLFHSCAKPRWLIDVLRVEQNLANRAIRIRKRWRFGGFHLRVIVDTRSVSLLLSLFFVIITLRTNVIDFPANDRTR